jgi:hypothetical protein
MTHKSIKLLALAVIFGCSLIGVALVPFRGVELREVIIWSVSFGSGIWFLTYWFLCRE